MYVLTKMIQCNTSTLFGRPSRHEETTTGSHSVWIETRQPERNLFDIQNSFRECDVNEGAWLSPNTRLRVSILISLTWRQLFELSLASVECSSHVYVYRWKFELSFVAQTSSIEDEKKANERTKCTVDEVIRELQCCKCFYLFRCQIDEFIARGLSFFFFFTLFGFSILVLDERKMCTWFFIENHIFFMVVFQWLSLARFISFSHALQSNFDAFSIYRFEYFPVKIRDYMNL